MYPSDSYLGFTLRFYQKRALDDIIQRVTSAENGRRFLYAGPTGVGKSVIELAANDHLGTSFLITPRLEIITGMLQKKGHKDVADWSLNRLIETAYSYRISTPVRFRNLLAKGEHKYSTDILIVDECHHEEADTYQQISAYLPRLKWVGLTATPFRGTPKSSKSFLDRWEDTIRWIIRVPEAIRAGVIALPNVYFWPICNDDEIEVVNGEFRAVSAEAEGVSRLGSLVDNIKRANWYNGVEFDKATMVAVSTQDMVNDLVERLNAAGLPAIGVTQDTVRALRNKYFADCENRKLILVQIDVVSEGVDLKIDRLIDYKPTMSPVRWKQQIGRIERPGGIKEYYCTNRNLERFCYLYEGMIPPAYVAQAQQVFGAPTKRSGVRAFGMEEIGRFKPSKIEFKNGCVGELYTLFSIDRTEDGSTYTKTEYSVLVHPSHDILYGKKVTINDNGSPKYSPWVRVDALPDLTGYQSISNQQLTEKQIAKWNQCAAAYGLDASKPPTRKTIQALFLLMNTGCKV